MSEISISANALTKYFGSRLVVDQVSFALPKGTVTGLIGLNGAGKTTTLRMLMGLLAPTRGHCEVLGVDSRCWTPEHRCRIGYTVEGHFLYGWMKVRESEFFQRKSFDRWNSILFQQTIARFGISPDQVCGRLSRGQRAGVSLALTLCAEPEVLILDDPSLGLDPISRRALNSTILDFVADGTRTVLISTHMLDDVERVADRILLMVNSRILVDATLDAFCSRTCMWTVELDQNTIAPNSIPGLVHATQLGNRWQFAVVDSDQETESALSRLGGCNLQRHDGVFDEGVIAYLSRTRDNTSFLNAQTAGAR